MTLPRTPQSNTQAPPPATMAALWAEYRLAAVPDDAGATQLQETQRAFYAGAGSLLRLLPVGTTVPQRVVDELLTFGRATAAQLDPGAH